MKYLMALLIGGCSAAKTDLNRCTVKCINQDQNLDYMIEIGYTVICKCKDVYE